jgi:hypothetical protein
MPRKPFLSLPEIKRYPHRDHGGPWEIGPMVVERRPEHVALIGRCMTHWPDVMHQLALLSGLLLGVNSEAAVAVFATIKTERGRRDAIMAAAEHTLDPQKLELLGAILMAVRSIEKERDNLAHGCYGVSDVIKDGILWIDSKHIGPWNVTMLLKEPAITGADHAELAKKIFVYRAADLEDIHQQIHTAWKLVFDFIWYMRRPHDAAIPLTNVELYLQLCNSPRVAAALSQIRLRSVQ